MNEILVKYDVTDAAIEKLKNKYLIVPVVEDNNGLADVKSRITVVRKLRTSVESKRKELKKDALEYGRKVDGEAKRITAELLAIEAPMKDAQSKYEAKVAAEKAELARIEAERKAEIQAKIDSISDLVAQHFNSSAFEIAEVIDQLGEPDDYDYGHLFIRYTAVLTQTLESLETMMNAASEREAEAVEANEKREREEAAAAERDRLAAIDREEIAEERRALAAQRAEEEKLNAEREEAAAAERERLAAIEAKIVEDREEIERERLTVIEKENARIEAENVAEKKRLAAEQARIDAEKKEAENLAASMVTCPHCQKEFSLSEVGR